jgi:hypothetical protein
MSFILGVLSVMLGFSSVILVIYLTKRTDELIKTEDQRAKMIIDEGNKRTQQILAQMQKSIELAQQMIDDGRREFRELIERMDRRISQQTYIVKDK